MKSRREASRARQEREAKKKPQRGKTKGEVVVPHDPVNEMVVIAAVIVDEKARKYLDTLPPDFFYGKGHSAMWSALQEIRRRGLAYDPATVRQISGGKADVEMLEEYIRERPVAPPNLRHHVECVKWDRARVESARGPVSSFIEALRDPTAEPERLRSLSRQISVSFEGVGSRRYLRNPDQLVEEHSKELRERREGRATYPFGIEELDYYCVGDERIIHEERIDLAGTPRLIPGAAPGKTTLLTGVSGSCKTTMSARLALGLERNGRKVLFGAWEQGSAMTLELIAAMSLGWSRTDLMIGNYNADEQQILEEEMRKLGETIRFFELPFGRARGGNEFNDRNLDTIQEHVAESGCEVFIADLLRRAFKETSPDDEEQALYRMQAMAQELRIHQIWNHQLRLKDLEQRDDKRPTRDTIKGSSGWVDVPDLILGFHRPALFKNVVDDTLQVIVLKQRYGAWPQAIEFSYDPEYGAIWDGKTVDYQRPGEEGDMDDFLAEEMPRRRKKKTRKEKSS